jgi:Na+/H+ antiporter NhaC
LKRKASFGHGLISLSVVALLMFYSAAVLNSGPQIPLLIGCLTSGLVACRLGYSWKEIRKSMLGSIAQSLEAILLLLLIGCLVGVWIASGAVPSLIVYGLRLLNARSYLPATLLICGAVSMAIGAWGTVGTVGIAFLGIGKALGIPPALAAACVVSGAYFGDAASPLSDATNLTAAVVDRSVFSVIRSRLIPISSAFVLSGLLYFLLGQCYADIDPAQAESAIVPLQQSLEAAFHVSPLAPLPMLIVLVCIMVKLPAIPSVLAGILTGALSAILLQGCSAAALFAACTEGYSSQTGQVLLDELLTAGGIVSMMNTISIVIIAMAFGGIMQSSGQMRALITPLASRIRRFGGLSCLAVFSCVGSNLLLPDQYLGISVPGQMLAEEYDRRGYSREALSVSLSAGAATSPLIPWNTCGIYCRSMLGVSGAEYFSFAFFGLLAPLAVILFAFICNSGRAKLIDQIKQEEDLP